MRKVVSLLNILEEEERLVRLLKLVKKERDRIIKEDILKGSRYNLLNLWKTIQK